MRSKNMAKLNEVFKIKEAPGTNLPNGEEGMTVADLIAILRKMPQDALVCEENHGEHRFLGKGDVKPGDQISDADSGEQRDGKFVILSTWG